LAIAAGIFVSDRSLVNLKNNALSYPLLFGIKIAESLDVFA
jgi:hypothetical protein